MVNIRQSDNTVFLGSAKNWPGLPTHDKIVNLPLLGRWPWPSSIPCIPQPIAITLGWVGGLLLTTVVPGLIGQR